MGARLLPGSRPEHERRDLLQRRRDDRRDGAGHAIHESAPGLVAAAVLDVVETVRAEAPLGPCAGRFDDVGGRCLA
jgi:hypothetical protein